MIVDRACCLPPWQSWRPQGAYQEELPVIAAIEVLSSTQVLSEATPMAIGKLAHPESAAAAHQLGLANRA